MGGFDVRKNISGLIKAWVEVRKQVDDDDLYLVLAGKLPQSHSDFFPHPLKLAAKLHVAERMVIPGWIEEADKPLLYASALVFVYPSLYEGFGLPVLEAMACGTPVVTSNTSSLPELAGLAAHQVDPRNTSELASAIAELCTVIESYRNARQRGLEQASKFTWADTAAHTLRAYQDVVG